MTIVLDAWALVAYLKGESAADAVEPAIRAGESIVSDINLGEVVYALSRSHGEQTALDRIRELRRRVHPEAPDWALTLAAARIKGRHPVSYADAFAVATAQRHDAPLYTGDPEIIGLAGTVEVVDLRPADR